MITSSRLRHSLSHSLLLLCLGASLSAFADSIPPMPPPQYYGNIVVVTGGIGSDEVKAFRRVRENYALSLNFSVAGNGGNAAFASDVQVVIRDSSDQTLLNITSDGPFCFIQLPPGNYNVHSTYLGQTQSRQVTISETPTALNIQWDAPS